MFHKKLLCLASILAFSALTLAQSSYTIINVNNGGTITGTVKWAGARPKPLEVVINKDAAVCDPNKAKMRDLERLEINNNGGVANTIVYLADITRGKAMDLPLARRSLNQHECRYEPHIFLVPQGTDLNMITSDPVLHNIHMTGASSYNAAFVNRNQTVSAKMNDAGLIDVQCNGGHAWMNAEIMVVRHPYYAVTDADGKFTLTDVPPGQYRIVAWHEGWHIAGRENKIDIFTQGSMEHIRYSEPVTLKKSVNVAGNQTTEVEFELSEHPGVETHAGE
jgi:hypothetical protein